MKYVALIPSYEPDDRLIKIIKDLNNNNFDVVLVNDGSDSKYDHIFKECSNYSTCLTYKTNHGKGYALKVGLKYIEENYLDVCVVTMDSDGQHTVKDATNLCNKLVNEYDKDTMILGRRLRGEKTPLRSKLGNSITRFVYRLSTGIDIYDTQTGLRAFKSSLIPLLLEVKGDRFEYEMNMLLDLPRQDINLVEEDIEVIYEDNNSGSHFNTIKDSARIYGQIFKQIFKYSIVSILSFVIDMLLFIINPMSLVAKNIVNRIISATINYSLNKKFVFEDKKKVKNSIFKYYLLAAFVLAVNTGILYVLVKKLHCNENISKLCVECVLFILTYIVQKKFVFAKRKKNINWYRVYGVIFTLSLLSFTTYFALDTFVLAKKQAVAITKHEEIKPSMEVIKKKNYYKDDNIEITISGQEYYGAKVHIADVKISDIKYLKTALAKNSFGRNIKEDTSAIAKKNNAIFAVNGDFYGAQQKGYVVRDGNIYRDTVSKNQESLVINNNGEFTIINQSTTSLSELSNLKEVLSFGPGLIMDGEILVSQSDSLSRKHQIDNPRTAIGMVEKNHLIFVVVDGRTSKSNGITIYELAKVMKKLNCTVAYNLDGGGSSTMYFDGKIINTPIDGRSAGNERRVSDIVYIGY